MAYGELETIVRISERSGLLINCDSSAMELMLRTFFPFWVVTGICVGRSVKAWPSSQEVRLEILGCRLVLIGPLFVGVVFFPSSPFMGVVLFPSPVR